MISKLKDLQLEMTYKPIDLLIIHSVNVANFSPNLVTQLLQLPVYIPSQLSTEQPFCLLTDFQIKTPQFFLLKVAHNLYLIDTVNYGYGRYAVRLDYLFIEHLTEHPISMLGLS